jgi:hypothetical protein
VVRFATFHVKLMDKGCSRPNAYCSQTVVSHPKSPSISEMLRGGGPLDTQAQSHTGERTGDRGAGMGSNEKPSSDGMPADVGPLGEAVCARHWERPGNALSGGFLHTDGLPMAASRMTAYEMIRDAGPVARDAHWLTRPFWWAPTSRSQAQMEPRKSTQTRPPSAARSGISRSANARMAVSAQTWAG